MRRLCLWDDFDMMWGRGQSLIHEPPTDEEQVTLLMLLDYSNIVYNMTFEDTRRTNFVLSELLIWTKYLHYDLQRMYEVADEIDQEKEALKEDVSRSPQRAAVAVTTTSGRSEHSG